MKSLIRRLFFRLWLRRKVTEQSSDYCLSMPLEVAGAEIDMVQRIAPGLTFQQQTNVTHRRLQLAAIGLKEPSWNYQVDKTAQEWWDG